MGTFFRFRIGPFGYSKRLGRTQAQKRAAAKNRAARQSARAERKWHAQEQERREQFEREYNSPEAVAAREDHDRRTYRAEIADCRINGVRGGSFVIRAAGHDDVRVTVPAENAMLFLSLKNRDIVRVTMAAVPESDGPVDWPGYVPRVEEFWHESRANGAEPRSPANFSHGFPWDRAS
jgi:hypothetical protein